MDNYETSEGGTVASTGGEYVFTGTDGEVKIITDEANGMGFLTIKNYDSNLCTASYTY